MPETKMNLLTRPPLDPSGNSIDIKRPIINNKDGSFSTERSITVQSDGLNQGLPTNIPTIWEGKELTVKDAVKRAIESRQKFPSFKTIEEAETSAIERSNEIGKLRQGEVYGPVPFPKKTPTFKGGY
jgi:hypothetical protein